jgi:hypothetical protein
MGIGQSWATPENDLYDGERSLHINGTRDRGDKIDFWMFVPKERTGGVVCGICKRPMEGKHCRYCYPMEEV